jgi:ribosomal-protein-alanine N-acetyltransferase
MELWFARATEADLDAIAELERQSFPSPWSREMFAAELTRSHARLDIARDERTRIVAFCNYWLVERELTIHAIASHPGERGRGVGRALLDHVLAQARGAGGTIAHLEVRSSNAAALALYTHAGFTRVHLRAGYYRDGEDAVVMSRPL